MIVKTPFRGLDRTEGAEEAPDKILDALKEIWLNEQGKKPYFNTESINIVKNNVDENLATIENSAEEFLKKANDRVIFLGGDHSISYSTHNKL